jgi:hypothetical protein
MDSRSPLVHVLELRAPPNPFMSTEAAHRIGPRPACRDTDRSAPLFAADRQTFAALRAAALEHEAAVLGAHPHQEPVSLFPAPGIRLKCALTLHKSPYENEPPMLANAFGRCQCTGVCATVCDLHGGGMTPQAACAFGLSPKFSTPVEKTVEINGSARYSEAFAKMVWRT